MSDFVSQPNLLSWFGGVYSIDCLLFLLIYKNRL